MLVTALTYVILAVSGLLGSLIAWDDLKKAARRPANPEGGRG